MSSTFTSPIRIFKRNNPSNDGTIAPDNTGAAQVTQQQYITNPITATTGSATVLSTADVGSTTAITGAVGGTFSVEYTARNVDGSITAYGSGYTNN